MTFVSVYLPFILLYALFYLWYDNRRGPLRPDEIDRFMEAIRATPALEVGDLDTLRRFLEADDGREFLMLNLVKLAPGEVPHPITGTPVRAGQLMREYVRPFLGVMIRHAGHPALQAPKIGGYVDAWNVPPDPGWSFVGMMRYRSRRDLAELITDPRFMAAHPFKLAAIPVTASFPTALEITLMFGPRIWVAGVLAIAAMGVHLAVG